ncbi:recombinase family protein [Fictibacillus sp. KIGAM418]|uniref:Recombinase family protein n=1 Tax=Fictibacillus marinisediminis TaxID=2878389 RepID=A0A9X1XA19_9BACL|nr:recombinase family protein [Fictibacillus marinisediminis]MCK6256804.1 recombinase family protein [Fictibacillus marinisediminis]
MKIGYARVSTLDQSLDMQMDALKAAGCDRVFTEHASGAQDDRPELQRALDILRPGDVFVVWKLDRLARSTKKLITVAEQLEAAGVELVSIQDRIDTTTAIGKAMFRMIGVIAELERDMIRERTQAGLAAARARGRMGGRPKADQRKIDQSIALYDTQKYTVNEICDLTGISRSLLYRELKKRQPAATTR